MSEAAATPADLKKRRRKIPEALVYEEMDGRPYYRKGYKAVLHRHKKLEDIMGSSTLQSEIHIYLLSLLLRHFDLDDYTLHSNEAGLHLGHGNNLAGDILVYERRTMTPENINKSYSKVPPLLVFEIDIKADLEKESDLRYLHRKIHKLLGFGAQKIFWILTEARKVLIAEAGQPTVLTVDWDQDVAIQPGLHFNIDAYLQQRGITLD